MKTLFKEESPLKTVSRASIAFALFAALIPAALHAACTVTESKRKFEGAERTIVTMENERLLIEIAPDLEGRVIAYKDKTRPRSPFEWLDDCPYHYNCRWEGKPFTYRIDSKGPERAAVTVIGGGNVSVGDIHRVVGVEIASPLDLTIERTMSIDPDSSRLKIEVKIKNVGNSVAPSFRYMVHAVYGQVPHMPEVGMYWFLAMANDIEVFSAARGNAEMWQCASLAPVGSPFNRWSPPDRRSNKPRYEAGGWGAMLTSAGPAYIYYEPAQFDFMQYWYGGDAEWHFTFEPQTKAIDLKPGETTALSFTLAYDSKDVPFNTKTLAMERPSVAPEAMPGGALHIKARATTVQTHPETAAITIEVKDPKNQVVLSKEVSGEARPFSFTDLSADLPLPAEAALGKYAWTAKYADGKTISAGQIEVMTPAEADKRKTERAIAGVKTEFETKLKDQYTRIAFDQKLADYWRQSSNLALSWNANEIWPAQNYSAGQTSVTVQHGVTPVFGLWKQNESVRIKSIAAAAVVWPENVNKLIGTLGADLPAVRSIAPEPGGKGLAVLLVDAKKKRVEVVRVNEKGIVRRFGRFTEQPSETDDALGAGARALAVDREGNIWVGTNSWGETSVFKLNQDNSPYEESVIGVKGALKKFSPDGRLLGTLSLLDTPTELLLAEADKTPVLLAPYRNVSAYHGAMVRAGMMVVSPGNVRRMGELKIQGASIAIDAKGKIWAADVAGHVACFEVSGKKLLDVPSSLPPAVLDARLPWTSPMPAVLTTDANGQIFILYTLRAKLSTIGADGVEKGEAKSIVAPGIQSVISIPSGTWVLSEKGLEKQ